MRLHSLIIMFHHIVNNLGLKNNQDRINQSILQVNLRAESSQVSNLTLLMLLSLKLKFCPSFYCFALSLTLLKIYSMYHTYHGIFRWRNQTCTNLYVKYLYLYSKSVYSKIAYICSFGPQSSQKASCQIFDKVLETPVVCMLNEKTGI